MAFVEDELARLEAFANLLDSQFRIPGTNVRFGLDPLIGLVPVAGDAIGAIVSLYIVSRLAKLELSHWVKLRMIWNILLDFTAGSVPLAGDAFDVAFKVNKKNVALARKALARRAGRKPQRRAALRTI